MIVWPHVLVAPKHFILAARSALCFDLQTSRRHLPYARRHVIPRVPAALHAAFIFRYLAHRLTALDARSAGFRAERVNPSTSRSPAANCTLAVRRKTWHMRFEPLRPFTAATRSTCEFRRCR